MTARNLKAFEDGQAVRAAVKAIMAAHSPLARPLTAKAILSKLRPPLRRSERAIQAHMLAIQDETELQLEIDGVRRSSSPESSTA